MNIEIIAISDIHFGAFDAEVLFNELEVEFLKKIKHKEQIDLVVITGDYFDGKLNMNSKHAKYAIKFFKKLVDICIKKNAKLRVIQGTVSHDNNQLEILEIEQSGKLCDTKFIYNVTEEELFENFNVLYIPEEYMTDRDEYYKDYFNGKKYDMIFGHGMVQEVSFCALSQESATTMSKAPIFKTEVFKDICNGAVIFGHIHNSQIIKNCVHYVGSFSRWMQGEEEPKGYYEISYNTCSKNVQTKFVENTLARKFVTIEIETKDAFFELPPEKQIDHIKDIYDNTNIDYLRIKIHIPEEHPNHKLLVAVIGDAFSGYKHINIVFVTNSKITAKKQIEEKVNILLEKYGFIFDKTIDYDIKIAKFIQEKYGRNISVDKIRDYIFGK